MNAITVKHGCPVLTPNRVQITQKNRINTGQSAMIGFIKALFFIAMLFIVVPVSAHDLPIGGSRWCFSKHGIVGNIDLKASLFSAIKGIKEGHYTPDSISNDQLQQITTDIIQPYIDRKLSLKVDGKKYPVKVDKIVNTGSLYTIWLSVDHVNFSNPENSVKIEYSLLFEETGNTHVNLAYGYLSDLDETAVQTVFDSAQPFMQNTFDAKTPVWAFSIKGPSNLSTAEHRVGNHMVGSSSMTPRKLIVDKKVIGYEPQAQKAKSSPMTKSNWPLALSAPLVNKYDQENSNHISIAHNPEEGSPWSAAREFITLGIEHILTGYDHIAFLLALIVIGLSFKEVLKIITAFTVAHSITLLLAALQIVRLDSRFVESTIALSICYVAVENLLKKKVNYRWIITFVFGLVHGFGFASALQELIVGKSNLLLSVLSFNAGVELGQLMIVCVMLPLLYLITKKIKPSIVTAGASVSIFILGFAWFIERVFDLKLLWF